MKNQSQVSKLVSGILAKGSVTEAGGFYIQIHDVNYDLANTFGPYPSKSLATRAAATFLKSRGKYTVIANDMLESDDGEVTIVITSQPCLYPASELVMPSSRRVTTPRDDE